MMGISIADEHGELKVKVHEMRHGHDLDDWLDAEKISMENRDSHAKEIKQEVNVVKKPIAGFW